MSSAPQAYQVLARKYRPQTFDDLIGQEVLVRTLSNAFAQNRIAHAFMLTGIRGIGKTTTARIVAKALNCEGTDGKSGPTIQPCGVCENCKAITTDRHPDVLEIDAASRTGVDDIREIIDSINYTPAMARYRVYIIDEVHMLSKNAFNALLKTLEEPPAHAKFIFATTEIRKVPVTVLSRCQRFDLRRITTPVLAEHLKKIAEKEQASIEEEAVTLLAKAAEGSVRDGLSLLDQAIAQSSGAISAEHIRQMLGAADHRHILQLFSELMEGKVEQALATFRQMYDAGLEAAFIFNDLLEWTHLLTRQKATPTDTPFASLPDTDRAEALALAEKLTLPTLGRSWQMLLKGQQELRYAPDPLAAAEMALIRLAYAAELPSPAEIIRNLGQKEAAAPAAHSHSPAPPAPRSAYAPATPSYATSRSTQSSPLVNAPAPQEDVLTEASLPQPKTFEQVLTLFKQNKELLLFNQLHSETHLVRFEQGRIELRPHATLPAHFAGKVSTCLNEWTGARWLVVVSREEGAPTVKEQEEANNRSACEAIAQHPQIQPILAAFPGATVTRFIPKQSG